MRWLLMLILTAVLVPASARAQDGSDRPRDFGSRPGWDSGFGPRPMPAEDDQVALMEFLEKHSPNRLAMIESLMERRRYRTMWRTLERMRAMQRFQDQDPELYELMVRRFEAEDQVLGMLRQRQEGVVVEDKELREKIAEIVNITMQERQRRIEQLQQQLESEKRRLENDRARLDELIDRHLAHVQEEQSQPDGPDASFGPGGGGFQRGGGPGAGFGPGGAGRAPGEGRRGRMAPGESPAEAPHPQATDPVSAAP